MNNQLSPLTDSQLNIVSALLHRKNLSFASEPEMTLLSGDGSDRRFVRIHLAGGSSLMVVLPGTEDSSGLAEAVSCFRIGSHLYAHDVPVPEIYGFDEATGIVLFEDLGDILLYDLVRQKSIFSDDVMQRYREVLFVLAHMQTKGRDGFDPSYCYDTPSYDRELMLERESGYFLNALCRDLLEIKRFPEGLSDEFQRLASRAAEEPAGYLLHRDFQSRNIMLSDKRVRVVDFQGARFGPLGYDLASLLIDPYVSMPQTMQDELAEYYVTLQRRNIPLDRDQFIEGYYYMALQRNLQILGAFAFLSQKKGKTFFRAFLLPTLEFLHAHLEKPQGGDYPCLRLLVTDIINSKTLLKV